ncbi:hypothetical protein SynSYN20_01548 [Synechococcus sp. SYN20]|nr:hypothetical protein SynSYN20_01548 [Synechococcus sp. SYN20]
MPVGCGVRSALRPSRFRRLFLDLLISCSEASPRKASSNRD